MKRKILQVKDSTQLVSLPRKWAKRFELTKGEEIDIEEKENQLIISVPEKNKLKEVDIDITGLDRTSIILYIEILYRLGYDVISVKYKSAHAEHFRLDKKENMNSIIHYISTRLIGMEIIDQRDGLVVLKSLNEPSKEEFDTVFQRVFLLLGNTFEDFLNGLNNQDISLVETIEERHDTISKFNSYGMRILNKKGSPDSRNPHVLYHILMQLEKITDVIKYSARDFVQENYKLDPKAYRILCEIKTSLKWFFDLFIDYEQKKVVKLYLQRHRILKMIYNDAPKMGPKDIMIVKYFRHVLEILVDISSARMGLLH